MQYKRQYKSVTPQLQYGHGMPVFHGVYDQRGHGLGSFLGSLAKKAMPLLKMVGKRALGTGLQIAQDVIKGRNIKQSIQHRGKDAVKRAGSDVLGKLNRDIFGSPEDAKYDDGPPLSRKARVIKQQARLNSKPRLKKKRIKGSKKRNRSHKARKASKDIFE
jgi:hypothetical protein